ncbi:response regulator transcription factor [Chryseobacterium populi]|uniref:Response regulator containing a CheY-like receiver domain and an HTH DNA-binding domain n=1 Tax=Chryseobacterium populi TaxID=1144316 RepID=J2SVJ2_9FLAO|nr:helix-turn-helix transcriptional regulator [Chryseobacterium populi]EJL69602.1 response regulator containing a CheY-like receiver domain and an HTH DNA-binding domain [Chryseobacterium populi]
MQIVETLNEALLNKNPGRNCECLLDIKVYKQIALMYSRMENTISVLSDMQADKSYVYKSKAALELGLDMNENPLEIDSIWEEDILKKIHPDDKLKKYIHELRFFKFLDSQQPEERADYHVVSRMQMKDKNENYRFVQHRMFYVYSPYNGKLRFALCLYSIVPDQSVHLSSSFLIINSAKGDVVAEDKLNYKNILSKRELEVLKFVGEGLTSKEIADFLSISINTVSRHRQNILEKLKVKNSVQAFNDSFH